MARLFSINFEYQQHQYTALVTAGTGQDGNSRFTVSVADEQLKSLIPSGMLVFSDLADLRSLTDARLSELVHSLTTALRPKLYVQT